MAIVKLKKITLCGFAEESEVITNALQEVGVVHVIKQNEYSDLEEDFSKANIRDNIKALEYLVNFKQKLHMLKDDEDFDAEDVIEEITAMRQRIIDLSDQREILEKEIEIINPWGDFEFIPKEEIDNHKFYFYIMPKFKVNKIPAKTIYSVVAEYKGNAYVVVLAKSKPLGMPVAHTKTGSKSLGELQTELEDLNEEIDDIQTRRMELTKYRYLLAESLNIVNNEAVRNAIEYESLNDGDLFILKGYVGKNDIATVKETADSYGLATFIEEVTDKDNAPTLLKNPEKISGGEELVKFYSTPGYKALDPSNILFFTFAIFFAMIMSDFGYACVLGGALFLMNGKLKSNQTGKRIRTMSWFIVLCSLIWGAIVGSYFGTSPAGSNAFSEFAQKFKVLDMSNTNMMMKVSIYVGIAHVCLANLLTAIHNKHSVFALSKIGWIAICLSGIIYMPMIMVGEQYSSQIMQIAQYTLVTGLGFVLLFTGKSKNIFKRIIEGILGMTKLSGAFGDVLSYLRIFALGLASATLGMTSNQLATQVIDAMPTFGYLLAIAILIIGHTINFGLGIMSGVVHGLRLNVIEFFNWSISDDGYPFNAFKKTEIKKWINL